MNDETFLDAILDNPSDDTRRLVYADWLEEQGDVTSSTMAEFLRLISEAMTGRRQAAPLGTSSVPASREARLSLLQRSAQRAEGERSPIMRAAVESTDEDEAVLPRLQQLAGDLPLDWLALVSKIKVENYPGKREALGCQKTYPIRFDYICDRRWEDMDAGQDPRNRSCPSCVETVHYCTTIGEARARAEEEACIAVDIAIPRRDRDLEPKVMVLGRPSRAWIPAESERLKPDPVSIAREERRLKGPRRPL